MSGVYKGPHASVELKYQLPTRENSENIMFHTEKVLTTCRQIVDLQNKLEKTALDVSADQRRPFDSEVGRHHLGMNAGGF